MSPPCRLLKPTEMLSATATVSAIFVGSVWAGENRATISSFRRQNPTAFVLVGMVTSYILLSLLASIVFLSAVIVSLACKFRRSVFTLPQSQNLSHFGFFLLWINTYGHIHISKQRIEVCAEECNVLLLSSVLLSGVFAHASFRLRNMKNKLENRIEGARLKRSPMGILLVALGQQEESFQRIQSFLEGKPKE